MDFKNKIILAPMAHSLPLEGKGDRLVKQKQRIALKAVDEV